MKPEEGADQEEAAVAILVSDNLNFNIRSKYYQVKRGTFYNGKGINSSRHNLNIFASVSTY